MDKKPIFGQKWPKMHILGRILPFWGQNSYFLEREQKFWYSHIRKPTRLLAPIVFWSGRAPIWTRTGWQKLCEGTKSLRRKVWTRTKILIRSTFRFRVTAVFVKKNGQHTKKSSPTQPNPTVGAPSASNSPSALSAQDLHQSTITRFWGYSIGFGNIYNLSHSHRV